MTSILDQLASASGQREQDLNIVLAQKIASEKDESAVQELIKGLEHKSKTLSHDCIKTLYEAAALAPALLRPYAGIFVALLEDKDNRLQWGAMTALSALAPAYPDVLFKVLDKVVNAADKGTVITRDHAVRILVNLSEHKKYADTALPLLLEQVLKAPVNQVPSYAEQAQPIIDAAHKERFKEILHIRMVDMEPESKKKRVEKVLKKMK